jgi:hypothetical protein
MKKISCILLIGIMSILLVSCRKTSFEFTVEKENLDSYSISYQSSSSSILETHTFDKPEECAIIIDFFDSLEPSKESFKKNALGGGLWTITLYLTDGTEEEVRLFTCGAGYAIEEGEDEYIVMSSEMDLYDMFSEETRLQILVDGTIYYLESRAGKPIGYTEYGTIIGTTDVTPTEDCQMKARFEVTGNIFTNEATPDAIYILMSTESSKNIMYRFVTSELDIGPTIFWNGAAYNGNMFDGLKIVLRELPKTCEYIGNLHVINQDAIPKNDLEINCQTDSYGYNLEGTEVYFDSNDPDYIYVYQKRYWREGEYDSYIKFSVLQ